MVKPLFLVDLDDTLFQTMRKLNGSNYKESSLRVGAFDRALKPRSFLTPQQAILVDWMLESTEAIPVTARGTEELKRVNIPFESWAVTTHGAVILRPDGTPDKEWKDLILSKVADFFSNLKELQLQAEKLFKKHNVNGFARINYEYGYPIYLVMKHKDSSKLEELYGIQKQLFENNPYRDGYYIHTNSNNIAWLPRCIQKGHATQFLLKERINKLNTRPVIGFGDSVSDHDFLKHCHFWGVPQSSQLSEMIENAIGV